MVLVTCKASPGSKDHDCPGGINVSHLLESHPTMAVPRLVIDEICCGGGGGGKSLPGQPLAPLPPLRVTSYPVSSREGSLQKPEPRQAQSVCPSVYRTSGPLRWSNDKDYSCRPPFFFFFLIRSTLFEWKPVLFQKSFTPLCYVLPHKSGSLPAPSFVKLLQADFTPLPPSKKLSMGTDS